MLAAMVTEFKFRAAIHPLGASEAWVEGSYATWLCEGLYPGLDDFWGDDYGAP